MTEEIFKELGFTQIQVTREESGCDQDFYYWALQIGDIRLITNTDDEAEMSGWCCEIFDSDTLCIRGAGDLEELVKILRLNTHD